MAGIKLKSGADFCNFQATRMCLHNDSADPTSDFGIGRIYFNTSSSVGSGKHVRIYDGSNFRSLAYFDEVDSRIKTIEDMLSVDTAEGVVSTWNEIQAFLDSVQEGTDLMDLLNGKLSTSGGTIEGEKEGLLTIKTSATNTYIGFSANSKVGYLGLINGVFSLSDTQSDGFKTLIHSGNVGEYKAGGLAKSVTIWGQSFDGTGNVSGSLYFGANSVAIYGYDSTDSSNVEALYLSSTYKQLQIGPGTSVKGYNTYIHGKELYLRYGTSKANGFLLNSSGNVTIGDSDLASQYSGCKLFADGRTIISSTLASNSWVSDTAQIRVNAKGTDYFAGFAVTSAGQAVIQSAKANVGAIPLLINPNGGNVGIGTTDPKSKLHVAGHILLNNSTYIRSYLVDKETTASLFGMNASDDLLIGYGLKTLGDTGIYGKKIYLAPNGEAIRMLINELGNVGIGTTDPQAKLHVHGTARFQRVNDIGTYLDIEAQDVKIIYSANDSDGFCSHIFKSNGNSLLLLDGYSQKATVYGDLYVTGNIIADGEVSAGGAGTESGTGGGTSGGGDALIFSQEFTPSTQVVSIAHGLSATKGVIVQVWEQNADGQSWSVVLVDIEEVDSNNIKLNFGRTETTLHKVVVMG